MNDASMTIRTVVNILCGSSFLLILVPRCSEPVPNVCAAFPVDIHAHDCPKAGNCPKNRVGFSLITTTLVNLRAVY